MEKMSTSSARYRPVNRRAFLKLSGMMGLSLASATTFSGAAEAVKFNRKMFKVSKSKAAMGTFVTMTLINSSKDKAEEAMGEAYNEIDRLTKMMSRFDSTTSISLLNSEGYVKDIPPEVAEVVAKAMVYYRISNGTFDISVKPIVDLFKKNFTGGKIKLPSEIGLNRVLKLVGSDKIKMRGREIRFEKAGMGITLDGIAKGYIVDRASKILARHQIENHLINAGGDIRAAGSRGDKKPWTVAIQDPHKKKQYPDIIHMTDGAVATSGNYEIYFDREKMFHHIVDPKTGLSPSLNTSVSVAAGEAMDADALSTAVFVMDPANGKRFIDSLAGCECLIIAKGNKRTKSGGWKSTAT